jgi:hypothetical protein
MRNLVEQYEAPEARAASVHEIGRIEGRLRRCRHAVEDARQSHRYSLANARVLAGASDDLCQGDELKK